MPVAVHVGETLSLVGRLFENGMLRKKYGPKSEELMEDRNKTAYSGNP